MSSFRVLVTGSSLAAAATALLDAQGGRVVLMPDGTSQAQLAAALQAAPTHALLLRGNPPIGPELMDAAPHLQVISKHGAGVDSVDLAAAAARGIKVAIAGDANAPSVAEHTIALILALGRDIGALSRRTSAGQWDRAAYTGRDVGGRTLGIVGFGRIGSLVARQAAGLGLHVIALPRRTGTVDPALAEEAPSLAALLARSDIVSLHAPLTPDTADIIGPAALAAMRPGALLINTARGGLVDEAAVLAALQSGHLAGAALDTLRAEPPDPGNPLLGLPQVIVTPHIASATANSLARMGLVAARNIVAVLTGQPIEPGNLVEG